MAETMDAAINAANTESQLSMLKIRVMALDPDDKRGDLATLNRLGLEWHDEQTFDIAMMAVRVSRASADALRRIAGATVEALSTVRRKRRDGRA